MNRDLFGPTRHLPAALLILLAFVVWLLALGASPGAREGSDRGFVLTSGWAALGLLVVCLLYVPRKWALRLLGALRRAGGRIARTREVRALRRLIGRGRGEGAGGRRGVVLGGTEVAGRALERSLARRERYLRLEEAQQEVARIRGELSRLTSAAEAAERAEEVLRERDAADIARVEVREGDPAKGEERFAVRVLPREPLGRMTPWMRAHLWYGLAFALLVFLHGGGSLASPMGILLNGLSAVVVLSGIIGVALLVYGPARLARTERECGASLEEARALLEHAGRHLAALRREDALLANARAFRERGDREAIDAAWHETASEELARDVVSRKEREEIAGRVTARSRVAAVEDGVLTVDHDAAKTFEGAPAAALERIVRRLRGRPGLGKLRRIEFSRGLAKRLDEDPSAPERERDIAILEERRARYARRARRLARARWWMHAWRTFHIPASVVLTAAVIWHAFSIWWY